MLKCKLNCVYLQYLYKKWNRIWLICRLSTVNHRVVWKCFFTDYKGAKSVMLSSHWKRTVTVTECKFYFTSLQVLREGKPQSPLCPSSWVLEMTVWAAGLTWALKMSTQMTTAVSSTSATGKQPLNLSHLFCYLVKGKLKGQSDVWFLQSGIM